MKDKRPTPSEFMWMLIMFMLPGILALLGVLVFIGCGSTETMYKVSGEGRYTIYTNKHGDLIEVPWDVQECEGYKKPYHITTYNNVGNN